MTSRINRSRSPAKKKPQSYEVGYGKPPIASRFQKGVSGNLKGRPRKPRDAQATAPETNKVGSVSTSEISDEELLRLVKARNLLEVAGEFMRANDDDRQAPRRKKKAPNGRKSGQRTS